MPKSLFGFTVRCTGAHAACTCVAISALTSSACAADCGSLAGKTYGAATITSATSVAPPSSLLGKDPPAPVSVGSPFCRVQGKITPSRDSDINFEVWLPPAGAWNGKYQGVGNGAFAGSLILPSMTRALDAGYAVSGTDTGHSGGPLDSEWALGHPEKNIDFGSSYSVSCWYGSDCGGSRGLIRCGLRTFRRGFRRLGG
jgi:Tannase and feruloyl esterase